MIKKVKLYLNTIKYLKPIQIYFQVKRYMVFYKKIKYYNSYPKIMNKFKLCIKELDLDNKYLQRFDIDKLFENKISLLNKTYNLDLKKWNIVNASPLWNFNLHYFEYAIPLAAKYRKTKEIRYYAKFKELLNSWIDNNSKSRNYAWEPYTISLRIVNLLISFELFGEIFINDVSFYNKVFISIFSQYKYLIKNQEKHLLGNHYFENLKTIIICSIIFNEWKIFNKYFNKLKKEINEQILEDGLHFELSLMYHKIILEGIIRLSYIMSQISKERVVFFIPIIQKMINALVSLEKGMGKTPHFNDSADGVSKETYQLINAANRLFNITPELINEFTSSKYFKLYDNGIAILFDAGPIGPKYIPGHGHCDALSFEVSLNNNPIFVNSGTYQYQGELRNFFRSTEAHNTLLIDNKQQSEIWAEHRVGRRIYKNNGIKKDNNTVIGYYYNYLGNFHKRVLSLVNNEIIIEDFVKTKRNCKVQSFLHLAPEFTVKRNNDYLVVCSKVNNEDICKIYYSNIENIKLHIDGILTNYAPQFGILERKEVIEFIWSSKLKRSKILIKFEK